MPPFTESELEARKMSLGSSEVAAAIGLNPWRSPHALWLIKRGLLDEADNVRTRVGTLVEPIIGQLYREETGANIASFGTVAHPEHAWCTATPDACVYGVPRVVEIKCIGWRSAMHWSSKEDGIPDYYRTQVEWEMFVTGAEECDVAALIGGTDFRIYRIKRDPELCAMLFARVRRFWFDNVVAGVPPTIDGSEGARDMLRKLFPRSNKVMVRATPEADEMAERLIAAKEAVDRAEEAKEAAENRLRQTIGENDGVWSDSWRATWKTTAAGTRQFLFKTKKEAA